MSGRALVIGVIDGAESTVIVAEGVVGSMFANPAVNPANIFGNAAPITCHLPYNR